MIYHFRSDCIKGATGHDERIEYTDVESSGDTLDELIANATVGREDWNGNEVGHVSLGDIATHLAARVFDEMSELVGADGEEIEIAK